jgi:hypothetical protein
VKKSEEQTRQIPKAVVGMLSGMGIGVLLPILLGMNVTFGLGMGMFSGFTCGYCMDRSQPTRSRTVLGIFLFVLIGICAYVSLR